MIIEKRTGKGSDVSGHIKVNMSVSVEGESSTSFHQQYIKLHEVNIIVIDLPVSITLTMYL